MTMTPGELDAYLGECRQLALEQIQTIIPHRGREHAALYELMLDYPLRHAKALRPALCIATCRALGGHLETVLPSAAVLELYHNAFLIHDDVEDGSEERRDRPTLHRTHGVPIAVNVGDGMLALALGPLLDNMRTLGMGKALRILQAIARMARESAEGQAIELDWIRHGQWQLRDAEYIRMVYKKTSWYTFITPTLVGGMAAGAEAARLTVLRKFASLLGIAFQIQDDVLNLTAERSAYGKEIGGDLWEGKHTLLLLHALRSASTAEQARAHAILRKRRPAAADGAPAPAWQPVLADFVARGELPEPAAQRLAAALQAADGDGSDLKTADDVRYLLSLIDRARSAEYARQVARRWAEQARRVFDRSQEWLEPSIHRDFLETLIEFVIQRDR